MAKETINQAEEIAQNAIEQEYVNIQQDIEKLAGSKGTIAGVVERLVNINARMWENTLLAYGEEYVKDIYEVFKCRLFLQGDEFIIVQGQEIEIK